MSPDAPGPAEPTARPLHRPSRRIHYWILGFVLVLVTASFLWVRFNAPGTARMPAHAVPSPTARPGSGWLRPARHFLDRLRRASAVTGPRRPAPRRIRRVHVVPPPRAPAPGEPGSSRPTPPPVWASDRIEGRASPILAWSGPRAPSRSHPRRRMLHSLIRRLEPANPDMGRTGGVGPVVGNWNRRSALSPAGQRSRAKRHWLRRERQAGLPAPEVILPPPEQPVLMPGSVIPAVLLSEIDSDLPGMIVARVTRTVFDSVHERFPMIPRGATLVGYYSSQIAQGQTRVLASFSEVIFPDGRRVALAGMQAADAYGASGLKDEVDSHFWKIFGSSFLIAALSALLPTDQSTVVVSPLTPAPAVVGSAAGQALLNTSQTILARNEDIPPTLIIRPGFRFRVMVSRPIAWARFRERTGGTLPRGFVSGNLAGRTHVLPRRIQCSAHGPRPGSAGRRSDACRGPGPRDRPFPGR